MTKSCTTAGAAGIEGLRISRLLYLCAIRRALRRYHLRTALYFPDGFPRWTDPVPPRDDGGAVTGRTGRLLRSLARGACGTACVRLTPGRVAHRVGTSSVVSGEGSFSDCRALCRSSHSRSVRPPGKAGGIVCRRYRRDSSTLSLGNSGLWCSEVRVRRESRTGHGCR